VNVPTLRLRPLALAAFTAVVMLALQAAPALADTATFEQPAGPAASAIDHVYRAVLGVTVTIFVLVGGWLLYSALRFRVRRGEPNIEPPQVRGSTRLEIGWTLAPVLVLAALAGYTIDNIPAVKDAPSDAMVVKCPRPAVVVLVRLRRQLRHQRKGGQRHDAGGAREHGGQARGQIEGRRP